MREGAIKIRIDRATKDALGAIAKSRGEGISMVVREAIRIYLAETDTNLPPALRAAAAQAVQATVRKKAHK